MSLTYDPSNPLTEIHTRRIQSQEIYSYNIATKQPNIIKIYRQIKAIIIWTVLVRKFQGASVKMQCHHAAKMLKHKCARLHGHTAGRRHLAEVAVETVQVHVADADHPATEGTAP